MEQKKMINEFNTNNRYKFNNKLFVRSDDELILALKNVIYSCERDGAFIIKVLNFQVIENYDDIISIMRQYEDSLINKKKQQEEQTTEDEQTKKKIQPSSNKKDNIYDYINLKDSDIKLIRIDYFIQINEKKEGLVNNTITVYLAIPRLIDDFYYRINGKMYSAMYQIVDASTYNNTGSKKKEQVVTLKTIFTPIRMARYVISLKTINNEVVNCTYFISSIFKKSLLVMKYFIAKMGFYESQRFFNIRDIEIMDDISYIDTTKYYIFEQRGMYIVVDRYLYDNVQIVQSYVYTVYNTIAYMKNVPYENMKDKDIWLKALGGEFTSFKNDDSSTTDVIVEKGKSVLSSLEFVYDKLTKEDLKLSKEDKEDIYCILRWMMYEYQALRNKDNLDISTKKIRWAEYLAAMYATRLSTRIYNISDQGRDANLNSIRKAIQTPPMYLIKEMTKSGCKLVNYVSCVNDMNSIIALKYTYKGISGIGERSNSISHAYRNIHPSHLGRVDVDSSSNSDPGISGTICPLSQLYDGHFDDYEEPSTWKNDMAKMMDMYNCMNSKRDMCRLINDSNLDINNKYSDTTILDECIALNMNLMHYALDSEINSTIINGYDLYGDGLIFITYE